MSENIQRYDVNTKTLEQPHSYKVRRILELGCLHQQGPNEWKCYPIKGYNSTIYTIVRVDYGDDWRCNCQGFTKRQTCSHEQALKALLIKIGDSEQGKLF